MNIREVFKFYKNKNVFITGHTGFKGSWLSMILIEAGANVTGYSLKPPTNPSLFNLLELDKLVNSHIGDIRDREKLLEVFVQEKPEIVFHLAAQPIVRDSYKDPVTTYETNVMGTVNILECIRHSKTVKSFVNVTTDKVYENKEWEWGYRENDRLDGFDPYSNSKSCSELITHSYIQSFFADCEIAISTARAGNVIGGGDFANDRIIPDCIRAMIKNEKIIVRNPHSIRPYQHVMEPVFAYLMIAKAQYDDKKYAGAYNVGPDDKDCINTGELADIFCESWGIGAIWENQCTDGPHEANFLKLDCSKLKNTFSWTPRLSVKDAVELTVEWAKAYASGSDIKVCMQKHINSYME
jgi:CDP-glucose 4,6-dehydratase